jgi:hypothetical protein
MSLARGEDDGFVKRLVFPAVAFAEKNSEQDGFGWNLHKFLLKRYMVESWIVILFCRTKK